jgi:Toxin SymE, type I toxin-antitoxin system
MATEDLTPSNPPTAEALSTPEDSPSQTKTHKPRRLKVSSMGPGVSYLRLQGRWLQKAGFNVGNPVRVDVMDGCLIVEPMQPEEPTLCAEPGCPHEARRRLQIRRQEQRPREWEWRPVYKV